MKWRVLAAVLLALVVGGVVGVVVAQRTEPTSEARVSFSDPTQLPASDPSIPVTILNPDPRQPALEPALDLVPRRLAIPKPDGTPSRHYVDVDVPKGWDQSFSPLAGEPPAARWNFTLPRGNKNGYVLRVDIYTPSLPLDRAISARKAALGSTQAQGFVSDVTYSELDEGFRVSYVQDDYLRISLERFFTSDGLAYATVAVTGREKDVPGMTDLLDRMTFSLRTGR